MILEYEDPFDIDRDGISGRSPRIDGELGRFGWKGTVPSLDKFVAVALAVEMGLSSPGFPSESWITDDHPRQNSNRPEVGDTQVRSISQFIRLLGAPPDTAQSRSQGAIEGQKVFQSLRCDRCHRENLSCRIDGFTYEFRAYTDLLVHDMGPELADGISEKGVAGAEFRTPPLWGLWSTGPPFLHDGRAKTLSEAIESHGGEGREAANAFKTLSDKRKGQVIEFMKSL
jgi:CxxC motif-containing protein (DUF1111 family)